MKEKLNCFMSGAVRITISGSGKDRFVNLCKNSGIYTWDIRNEESYSLCLRLPDFYRLPGIRRKTGGHMKILEKYGLPFLLWQYRKRTMFLLGLITSFVMIFFLSRYIWALQVDGNYYHSREEILKYLESRKITQGIRKCDVDCEKLEAELRDHYFDITWVSAEISGTRLFIHIKENETAHLQKEETGGDSPENVIAKKDAILTDVVVRSGTPVVAKGAEVKTGDLLVLGSYDIKNDEGEVVRTQYLKADADIYGKTEYPYEESIPMDYTVKTYGTKKKCRYGLRFEDLFFNRKGDQRQKNTEEITEEQQLSLYGDFYLPVYLTKTDIRSYEEKQKTYTESEAKKLSEEKLSYFLSKLQKNTVQIMEKDVTIEIVGNQCRSSGKITAIEKIGQSVVVVSSDQNGAR